MGSNSFESIYKVCNNGKSNKEKFEYLEKINRTVPLYIDIELTNFCNFQCRMCPTGTGAFSRKQGFMSDEVIERVCENLSKYDI